MCSCPRFLPPRQLNFSAELGAAWERGVGAGSRSVRLAVLAVGVGLREAWELRVIKELGAARQLTGGDGAESLRLVDERFGLHTLGQRSEFAIVRSDRQCGCGAKFRAPREQLEPPFVRTAGVGAERVGLRAFGQRLQCSELCAVGIGGECICGISFR